MEYRRLEKSGLKASARSPGSRVTFHNRMDPARAGRLCAAAAAA